MKCTKIILTNRSDISKSNTNRCSRQDLNTIWFTTRYSSKLHGRTNGHLTPREQLEPHLTITTLNFPDDTAFNTGSSMDRWSKKTPRLTSAKRKNHTPRKNMLDDEYDFSYAVSEIVEENKLPTESEGDNLALNFDEYSISSDIEQLILNSKRTNEENSEKPKNNKKERKSQDNAKKKRSKFKKTIRFSFSKPPSPETEQVIRVDVTTNVSFEEMAQLENYCAFNDNLIKNECNKIINEKIKDLSSRKFDNNNNEKYGDLSNERVEENFIVKCRQLALTQKKR